MQSDSNGKIHLQTQFTPVIAAGAKFIVDASFILWLMRLSCNPEERSPGWSRSSAKLQSFDLFPRAAPWQEAGRLAFGCWPKYSPSYMRPSKQVMIRGGRLFPPKDFLLFWSLASVYFSLPAGHNTITVTACFIGLSGHKLSAGGWFLTSAFAVLDYTVYLECCVVNIHGQTVFFLHFYKEKKNMFCWCLIQPVYY